MLLENKFAVLSNQDDDIDATNYHFRNAAIKSALPTGERQPQSESQISQKNKGLIEKPRSMAVSGVKKRMEWVEFFKLSTISKTAEIRTYNMSIIEEILKCAEVLK